MNTPFETPSTLLPAIVQDARTGQVLMLAYMNEEAYLLTKETKRVTFYSRSRKSLWTKGETSGNFLNYLKSSWDCDQDTLLVQAIPEGNTCHTGSYTCFGPQEPQGFLGKLEEIIAQRLEVGEARSYVAKLAADGSSRIAQKVGEEGVEMALALVKQDREEILNECADLFFHALVGLRTSGLALSDVESVLMERNRQKEDVKSTS